MPFLSRLSVLLLLACAVLTAGCFAPAPAPEPEPGERFAPDGDGLELREFARHYGLELRSATADRYDFAGGGHTLQVFPRLTAVNFDGTAYTLPARPTWKDGRLFFPRAFLDALPATLRERGEIPPAPEPSPAPPAAPAAPAPAARPRLVIIDAGHGGHDAGAVAHGLREKDLTLDIARRLRAALDARGCATAMTRESDVFLTLDDRSRLANRHSGAVFVSVHMNAARGRGANGVETFWISGAVSDDARARTAAQKYAFIGRNGRLSRADAAAKAKEIATRMRRESQELAAAVQARLVRDLGESDRGVKQANFAVLRNNFFGAVVLTEAGFLTDAATARRLATPAYRQKIADAIAAAVAAWLNRQPR